MATRLGLVGLCTSHPNSWLPIIRTLAEEGVVDVEVTACWDSGETRPEGFAAEFAAEKQIPHAVDKLEDMIGLVDAVIVHTTNWDKHIEQARPFVEAGLPVLIDKPVAGNLADIRQLLDWEKTGAKITGGSSLRFVFEVAEYLARPVEERGEVHTAFAGCGTDEYNYGIHAYSLLCGLMGTGLRSVTYLGMSGQKHIRCRWGNGSVGFLSVGGEGQRLPFHVTAIAAKGLEQIRVDNSKIYRALLEATLPFLCGAVEQAPFTVAELVEPELAAIAARRSWLDGGTEVFLSDLHGDDEGYDGTLFADGYRRARM